MLKNNLAKHLIHVGVTILTLTLTVVMQILPGVKKLLWWYLPSVILTLSLLYPGLYHHVYTLTRKHHFLLSLQHTITL